MGKVDQRKWSPSKMTKAIDAVRKKYMGWKKASKQLNAPKTTLMRLSNMNYGTPEEVAKTKRDEIAGKKWVSLFHKHHKTKLSERKPTGTSYSRAVGFSKENTDKFYKLLEDVYEKGRLNPLPTEFTMLMRAALLWHSLNHTQNIDLIDLAKTTHVTIVSLPPHSSHKLQPLDKSFMGPLKVYYSEEIRQWLRYNGRTASAFDANKKRDSSFYESVLKKQTAGNQSFPENREECDVDEPQVIVEYGPNQPSTSSAGLGVPLSSATLEDPQGSTSSKTSPFDITPIPKIQNRTSNRGRKACCSTVITSTPYKAQLVEAKKAKYVKEAEQQARDRAQGCKSNRGRGRGSAKNVKESSSEDESSVSSGTSELELLLGVSPSKDDDVWCIFVTGNFPRILKGNFVSCALCARCGPMSWPIPAPSVIARETSSFSRYHAVNELLDFTYRLFMSLKLCMLETLREPFPTTGRRNHGCVYDGDGLVDDVGGYRRRTTAQDWGFVVRQLELTRCCCPDCTYIGSQAWIWSFWEQLLFHWVIAN
ncbi:hypothetical protein PR048_000610 [Dryococelus australis]|uniref:DDE-1 domain-containing protein n=1 Tax=Dryococelus australis TaxID=614101 RepID=A0ABQ9IGI9_9NEOP|nr:hypothetical protein PR048_000610 [Dryococelus australis]